MPPRKKVTSPFLMAANNLRECVEGMEASAVDSPEYGSYRDMAYHWYLRVQAVLDPQTLKVK